MNTKRGREVGISSVFSRSRTVAIDVLLTLNFAIVFGFNVFLFPPCLAQFSGGDVTMNRHKAGKYSPLFLIIFVFCVTEGESDSEETEMRGRRKG